MEVQFFFKMNRMSLEVARTKYLRNLSARNAFPIDISPPTIRNVYSNGALEEETLLFS